MNTIKTVGVKFQDMWQIVNIPVPCAPNGDAPTLLSLDHIFTDRSTSISFKGHSLNGRLLYRETDCKRRIPFNNPNHDNKGNHLI
jgi:hypothetical protein